MIVVTPKAIRAKRFDKPAPSSGNPFTHKIEKATFRPKREPRFSAFTVGTIKDIAKGRHNR